MPSNPAARARMDTIFWQVASAVTPSMVNSDGDGGGLRCGCIDAFDFFFPPALFGRGGACADVDVAVVDVVGAVLVVAAAVSASTGLPRGWTTAMMSDMVLDCQLAWTSFGGQWLKSETDGFGRSLFEGVKWVAEQRFVT